MKTILIIEAIVLYQVFIIGALFWMITDILNAIKKHKKEKAKKNFEPLDKL